MLYHAFFLFALIASVFSDGNEYGVIGQHAVQLQAKREAQAAKITSLYQGTVYPGSLLTSNRILQGDPTVLADTFRSDVIGRIMPLGTFNSLFASAEYFYGLTNPPAPQYGPTIAGITIQSGPSCDNNECWIYNIFHLNDPLTGQIYNLTHYGAFYWDEPREEDGDSTGRIAAYDISFRLLHQVDYIKVYRPFVDPYMNKTDAEAKALISGIIANQVCQIAMSSCTGDNQVYSSYGECMASLIQVDLGVWNQADQRTLQCYQLHSGLAVYDPETHCPHIATPSTKCYDKPISSYFEVNYPALKAQDAELGNPARAA